jgi:hypothetical protein
MADVLAQRIAQLGVVGGAEVYFIVGAIEAKADGAFCLAAVDVVDEERLDLLGHGAPFVGW